MYDLIRYYMCRFYPTWDFER